MKTSAVFFSWLALAGATTGLLVVILVVVQQNYREALNDPQIQLAEDGAARLEAGGVPADIVPRDHTVDIGASSAPWVGVYDGNGAPLEADAVLDGAPPRPPAGVFDASAWPLRSVGGLLNQRADENRVTWQPNSDVRQALVIVPAGKYFVVAGRNMREVEDRSQRLAQLIFISWIVLMACITGVKLLEWKSR